MDIFNTEIVLNREDVFWEDSQAIIELTPKPVLVITTDLQPGGPESEQLNGILTAGCGLTAAQYNIVQLDPEQLMAWYRLREAAQPRVVITFNITPSQLGISALLKLNDINRFDNRFWVPSVSLTQVIEDKTMKANLWGNGLKPIFKDKKHGELL